MSGAFVNRYLIAQLIAGGKQAWIELLENRVWWLARIESLLLKPKKLSLRPINSA